MKNSIGILLIAILVGISCKSKVTNQETGATVKDVDVVEARKMITENKDLVILDVRTPEETNQGTIDKAMIIDFYDEKFEAKLSILDKSKPYLVYCRSGGRSSTASNKMIELGFKDVTNMEGGYTAWSK